MHLSLSLHPSPSIECSLSPVRLVFVNINDRTGIITLNARCHTKRAKEHRAEASERGRHRTVFRCSVKYANSPAGEELDAWSTIRNYASSRSRETGALVPSVTALCIGQILNERLDAMPKTIAAHISHASDEPIFVLKGALGNRTPSTLIDRQTVSRRSTRTGSASEISITGAS